MALKTILPFFLGCALVISPIVSDAANRKLKRPDLANLQRFGKYGCLVTEEIVVRLSQRKLRAGMKVAVVNVERERTKIMNVIHRSAERARAKANRMKDLEHLESAAQACAPGEEPPPDPTDDPTNDPVDEPTNAPDPGPAPKEPTATPTPQPTPVTPQGFASTLLTFEVVGADDSSGALELSFDQATYNAELDTATLQLSAPQEVRSATNQLLGTLRNISLTAARNPARVVTSFQFDVGAQDVIVRVRSGRVGLNAIAEPQGQARATFFVRDQNMNGVNLQMLDNAIYHPYSQLGAEEHEFGVLLGGIQISAGGQGSATHNDPPSGYRAVGTALDAIGDRAGFSITAGDRVVGSILFRLQAQ